MGTNSGFTITTNTTTNEEVTVNTTTDEVTALRDQIASLKEIVMGLAGAVAEVVEVEQESESHESDTSGDESVTETVSLSYEAGGPDPHGLIPSVVEAIRPDAPVEPEPEPEPKPEPVVVGDVGDADTTAYPKSVNGVRPSEDDSIYLPGRWSATRGDHVVAKALGDYIKWSTARGMRGRGIGGAIGITIDSTHPSNSLLDWIAFSSNNRRMTKAQARTALLRMEGNGHVKRVGKSGKQDLWTIDPNGGMTAYLA